MGHDIKKDYSLFGVWAVVLGAIFVRLAAAATEFNIDELVSLDIAQASSSLWEILSKLKVDNSHPLNTALLHWLAPLQKDYLIRVPALLCGFALLALPWLYSANRAAAMSTTVALGTSFYFVTYSSEARGYAGMLFCALWAFYLQREIISRTRVTNTDAALLAALTISGSLFHATFVFVYAGLVATSLRFLPWRQNLRLHFPSTIAFGLVYFLFYREIVIVGGDVTNPFQIALSALALIIGWWGHGPLTAAVAFGIVAVIIWLNFSSSRAENRTAFSAVVICWAASLAWALFSPYKNLSQERGYLGAILITVVMCAERIGDLNPRWAARALATIYLLGNLVTTGLFLHYGRGDAYGALTYIATEDRGPEIEISALQYSRGLTVTSYFSKFASGKNKYFTFRGPNHPGTRWILMDDDDLAFPPSRLLELPVQLSTPVGIFRREEIFPHFGLSGSTWVVYRAVPKLKPE